MWPVPRSRFPESLARAGVAGLVCLVLAASPAAAQAVKADGTPVGAAPAPKSSGGSPDAAVAAGVVAVGTALWLHHRQQVKKAAEAAAGAPPPAPVESAAAPAPEPAPAVIAEPPAPAVQAAPTPTPRPAVVHPARPAVHAKPKPAPAAEPAVVAQPAPVPVAESAPAARANSDFTLWIAIGILGALLLAAAAVPRMLMTPPTFRARARAGASSVAAPVFSAAKVEAA